MHSKVFVKLKKAQKPSRPGKKTQKNPLGWVFLKKPGFFPTLLATELIDVFNTKG
jgi:hypothetical protein